MMYQNGQDVQIGDMCRGVSASGEVAGTVIDHSISNRGESMVVAFQQPVRAEGGRIGFQLAHVTCVPARSTLIARGQVAPAIETIHEAAAAAETAVATVETKAPEIDAPPAEPIPLASETPAGAVETNEPKLETPAAGDETTPPGGDTNNDPPRDGG